MSRLFVPTDGSRSWRERLAQPELHWKRRASAMELAASWEQAKTSERGLPAAVEALLDSHPSTRGATLLFGFPEHKVDLPGGARASQTDLWALVKTDGGLASVAVEGKAKEPFGPPIDEWLKEPTPGKRTRLAALCGALGVVPMEESPLRYQLFHRAASAVLEARRTGASTAVLIVQSFAPESTAWDDFRAFGRFLNTEPCRGVLAAAACPDLGNLLLGWVDCPLASDGELLGVGVAPEHL